jgi:hypothetical protein
VEEEIPPKWEEFLLFLQSTSTKDQLSIYTTIPLQKLVGTGCIVVEEVPLKDHLGQNSAATMEKYIAMDSATTNDFVSATMDEDQVQYAHYHVHLETKFFY